MIVPRTRQTTAAVAAHYDDLDPFYREIWGEHVHHGFWRTGRETPSEATAALVDLLADRLELTPGLRLLDIGCGYGAAARHLARRHRVAVTGFTISGVQAAYAATASVPGEAVEIRLQDWVLNDLPDAAFDRAYAIESSEHVEDKRRFMVEAFRTLRPGGVLAIYAWLACDQPRGWETRHLLEPICREGRLAGLGDERDYRELAGAAGFHTLDVVDLSRQVRRTWLLCLRRVAGKLVTDARYRRFVAGTSANRVFALTLLRLLIAYRTGSIRYCLFVLRKPQP
jgi:tocopherol O-methyltransferase